MSLFTAAKAGNVKQMKALVDNGADVLDQHIFDSKTPFIYAAENGHLLAMKWLLKNGAKRSEGGKAMMCATENGHLVIVKWLVKNLSDDIWGYIDNAMLKAAEYGHLSIVQWLLEYGGASIETVEYTSRENALMIAAQKGNLAMCDWLLTFGGASIADVRDRFGSTVLSKIAQYFQFNESINVFKTRCAIILLLLDRGCVSIDGVWCCLKAFPDMMIVPQTLKPSDMFITLLMSGPPPMDFFPSLKDYKTHKECAETACTRAVTLRERIPEWEMKKAFVVTKEAALPLVVAQIVVSYCPPCKIEIWCAPRRNPERACKKRRIS